MSKPAPPANEPSALGQIGKEIVEAIRSGFNAYRVALETVSRTLLTEVEHERCERRKQVEELRSEIAALRELNGLQGPLQ